MWEEEGSIKETRNGGYLHRLRDTPHSFIRTYCISSVRPRRDDLPQIAAGCRKRLASNPRLLKQLSKNLGLPESALRALGVGWSSRWHAFTFPMFDASGNVVGIRLRNLTGRKWAVSGSRNGLFIPREIRKKNRLLICEGPTDCAALLSLGFWCIGRPDCTSCVRHVLNFIKIHEPKEVVVFSDRDEQGVRGASILASTLCLHLPCVRVVTPPNFAKDAREWINHGANKKDFLQRIHESTFMRLEVNK